MGFENEDWMCVVLSPPRPSSCQSVLVNNFYRKKLLIIKELQKISKKVYALRLNFLYIVLY